MNIIYKLKKIIKQKKTTKYSQLDSEVASAKIKNLTNAIASYGARDENFIGMLTITFSYKDTRISKNDDIDTIKSKTIIMYDSVLFFLDKLKKEMKKNKYEFIYLNAFELQKDGNLHAHIYFSVPLKAFKTLFYFYHNYRDIVPYRTTIKLNKKERTIVPIGRSQLGISDEFRIKLESIGYKFTMHFNPQKPDRVDFRCINFVSESQFKSGNWTTLFFYTNDSFKSAYSEKIVKYLTKNYSKTTKQKVIGNEFNNHHIKTTIENDEWSELQKQFIREVCGKVYTHSKLPVSVYHYQRSRTKLMVIEPRYRNFNSLIEDVMTDKVGIKNNILTLPNGIKFNLKEGVIQ